MSRLHSLALSTSLVVVLLVLVSSLGDAAPVSPSGQTTTVIIPAAGPAVGKDTYVDSTSPAVNFGRQAALIVRDEGVLAVQSAETLLYFDVAAYVPAGATVTGATLSLYQTGSSGALAYSIQPLAVAAAWEESKVTWANRPAATATGDAAVGVDQDSGWKQWSVLEAVSLWRGGKARNDGLLLRGVGRALGGRTFSSREGRNPPQLSITYTHTGTPTVTATPTRTPTPVPTVDLVADSLEVTQAVQDLNQSVRLVANKRTFVRFHMHAGAGGGVYPTFATLTAQSGGAIRVLLPINDGGVSARPIPDREALNNAFLFELPAGFRAGTVTLTANLNPIIGTVREVPDPVETTYGNNTVARTVTFETVPSVPLVLYRIGYRLNGEPYYPPYDERTQLEDWLGRAYPVSDFDFWHRTQLFGNGTVDADGDLTTPHCGDVNSLLWNKKAWDIVSSSSIPTGAHYYGMVSDKGGFMRGCAMDVPAWTAAGPTGNGTWGWDYDGSYGDWYGGHELAHTFGRGHANFCGAGGGPSYPYPDGRISPSLDGNTALYGFDSGGPKVYPPYWKDLMTYCDYEWMSDMTYEGLMDFFQSTLGAASGPEALLTELTDRLLVTGSIDPQTQAVSLQTMFVVPQTGEARPRVPGNYAIVLRSGSSELARYPFTPTTLYLGPDRPSPGPTPVPAPNPLLINEMVPYIANTTRVEIEGPNGAVLASVSAGANPPTVTLTSPNGGEVLSGSTVAVEWTASDPDGDPLRFDVQYSRDGGVTWEMLAQEVAGNSIALDAANVGSTTAGLFRVWVSDGIHTAFDVSNGTFTVPNRIPEVAIVGPTSGSLYIAGQTVPLEGTAYDVDTGSMQSSQLTWTSDRDGLLGVGAVLPFAGLSVGSHTITFRADDGQGGSAQASILILVTDDLSLFNSTGVYLPLVTR